MNQAVARYLSPVQGSFWRWKPEENLAVWADDEAWLAHRDEVAALLSALAPTGLPPLGALLLMLAATRPHWSSTAACAHIMAVPGLGPTLAPLWGRLADGLNQLHALPEDLCRQLTVRCYLAQTLFGHIYSRLQTPVSETIAADFHREHATLMALDQPQRDPVIELQRVLKALQDALGSVDFSTLETRLRTGIEADLGAPPPERVPAVPAPEEAENDLLPSPKDLLDALCHAGGELATVARLALQLRAVLHLPRRMAPSHDLPVGGVSDITNRGQPDRLLLSELAWDDLTFATRLAHHEALYLRRESPPADPPRRCVLVLDTTVRLWGVPRLMAVASALALQPAAQTDASTSDVYVLMNRQLKSMPLRTVEEVRFGLTVLEGGLFPLSALTRWATTFTPPAGALTDLVFLTHAQTAAEPDTTAQLRALTQTAPGLTPYVLSVERPDQLALHRLSETGSCLVQEARLDVALALRQAGPERLLSPRVRKQLWDSSADLPRYYAAGVDRLYFSDSPRPGHVFASQCSEYPGVTQVLIGLSHLGRLMMWTQMHKPARDLRCVAEKGDTLLSAGIDPTGQTIASLWQRVAGGLHLVVMTALGGVLGEVEGEPLPGPQFQPILTVESAQIIVRGVFRAVAFGVEERAIVHTWQRSAEDPLRCYPSYDAATGFQPAGAVPAKPRMVVEPKFKGKRHLARHIEGIAIQGDAVILLRRARKGLALKLTEAGLHLSHLNYVPEMPGMQSFTLLDQSPESLTLSVARWPDGRAAWFDPRGLLHLSAPQPQSSSTPTGPLPTLSILLVTGIVPAYIEERGRYYGDPYLLWGEPVQPHSEIEFWFSQFLTS
jgi:MoxR-vWA-beta-propeller ternary system domain bpX0/MoxR-vWA-beta-propeller ternary system domain bpX1